MMYKLLYPFLILVLTIFIACSVEQNNLDSVVHIVKVTKIGEKVHVQYQVENIGEKPIRGWNIYFRVSMESSKQIKAHHGLTYGLDAKEMSEILVARGDIPDHFDDVDKPSLAALQLIEVY